MLEKLNDNHYFLSYFKNYRRKLFATLNLEQAITNRPLLEVIDKAEQTFTARLRAEKANQPALTIV